MFVGFKFIGTQMGVTAENALKVTERRLERVIPGKQSGTQVVFFFWEGGD